VSFGWRGGGCRTGAPYMNQRGLHLLWSRLILTLTHRRRFVASLPWTLRVVLPARLFAVTTHALYAFFGIDEIGPEIDLAAVLPLELGNAPQAPPGQGRQTRLWTGRL